MAARFAYAQELNPRAYAVAPVGGNVVFASYSHSFGDLVFEPSFPAKDTNANLNFGVIGYYRSFNFFGRFANITGVLPYAHGHLQGTINGNQTRIYRSGPGDMSIHFALNLKGAPPMSIREFMKFRPKTLIGTSILIHAPTGQYDSTKAINIGTNRWSFKPELGVARYFGR